MADIETSSKKNKSTHKASKKDASTKSVSTKKPKSVKPGHGTRKKVSKENTIIKRDAKYKKVSVQVQKIPYEVSPKFKIYWVNTIKTSINGSYVRHIYRIVSKDKSAYFYVPAKAKYAYIQFYRIPYIFKVDPDAKSLTSNELTEISNYTYRGFLETNTVVEEKKYITRNMLFNSLGISNLSSPFLFYEYPDLSKANIKIEEINAVLHKTCPNLSLHLDYVYNMDFPNSTVRSYSMSPSLVDPLLCLYNEDGCISSISLNMSMYNRKENKYDTIYIASKTDAMYENKKYNKLLRGVTILISNLISKDISRIFSETVNPVSTYMLMKYFGGYLPKDPGHNDDFFAWVTTNNIELGPETYRSAFEDYFNYTKDLDTVAGENRPYEYYNIVVYLYINEDTIDKAQYMVANTLKELSCN